jgi:hypothetical protein
MVIRGLRRLAGVLLLGLTASCEIESTTIPRTDPTLVIHSVLNATARTQLVLVEESLTGGQSVIDEGPYDPDNPIGTGNGVPVSGAIVKLTDPDGIVMTGVEIRTQAGFPTGMYEIRLNSYPQPSGPLLIKMGRRYSLSVSAKGLTATGTTLVPRAASPVGVPLVPFNRDIQSISLPITDVEKARAYWVRIEAAVSAYSVFTLDQTVAISGDTRNLFTEDLLRVFFPGFLQTLTVAAVDSNVYDYYRSGNDPFSGRGLINRIEGGLGLFGSMVVVEKRVLDVTQDPTGDPLEATYSLKSGGGPDSPHTLRLFLESKGLTAASDDRVTGYYIGGPPFFPIRGSVLGARSGAKIDLQILEPESTFRLNSSFTGVIVGDSLKGTFSSGAPGMYVKQNQ